MSSNIEEMLEKNAGVESDEVIKIKKENQKDTFIKKFLDFHMNKSNGGGVGFINKVSSEGAITLWLKDELQKYSTGISEFEGVEISSISYFDIMSQMSKNVVVLNNLRTSLTSQILTQFDISSSILDTTVTLAIQKLEQSELEQYVNSHSLIEDFLTDIMGVKPVSKDILKHLKKYNLAKRYSSLDNDSKDALAFFFHKLEKGYKFSTTDFENLFSSGVFSSDEKFEFVQVFIPNITLDEALKLELLDPQEAGTLKKRIIIEGIKTTDSLQTTLDVNELALKLDNKDVIIPTRDFSLSEMDIQKLVLGNMSSFIGVVDEFNRLQEGSEKGSEEGNVTQGWLRQELSKNQKVTTSSIQKVKKGSIMILKQAIEEPDTRGYGGKEVNEVVHFIEIIDLNDTTGEVEYRFQGEGTYRNAVSGEIQKISYKKLVGLLQVGGTQNDQFGNQSQKMSVSHIDFLTPQEVNEQIQGGEIKVNDDVVRLSDRAKLEITRDRYVKNKRSELEDQRTPDGGKKYSSQEIDRIIENDAVVDQYESEIETADITNKRLLCDKVDEKDPDGKKYGLELGTVFQVGEIKDGKVFGIFRVTGISESQITITSFDNIQEKTVGFQDFYDVFRKRDGKRTGAGISNFSDLISDVSGDSKVGTVWEGFTFDGGELKKKKEKEETGKITYPYLASGSEKELVKITSIDGEMVTIHHGEIAVKNQLDKKGNDLKDGEGNKLKIDEFTMYTGSVDTVHISALGAYIKTFGLKPRSLNEHKEVSQDAVPSIEGMRGNMLSKIFKNYSIAEVIGGITQGLEGIKGFLEEGTQEHSAMVALTLFGKLPEEVTADLRTRVEQSRKKNQDAYMEKLEGIDSGIATNLIAKRLLNKDTPEYKKEAGLAYVLNKYGTLYAKKGLKEYRGTFLWYRAMGGEVGDAFYLEQKKKAEDRGEVFNEEGLIYVLMVVQCGENWKKFGAPHQRRSKFHKEIKKKRAVGKNEEIETGRNDAADERTTAGRLKGGLGELTGGTYPNAIGWAERVIEKGGSIANMSEIIATMALSGVAYTFDTNIISDAIKNLPAKGYLVPMARFLSYEKETDLLFETVTELSHSIEERTGEKYEGMGKAAQHLFDTRRDFQNNSGKGEKYWDKKYKEVGEFYKKYGDVLMRSLYGLNDGKEDEDSHLSKLIFLEKDDHEIDGEKRKGNNTFKRYYDFVRMTSDAEANFQNKDLMTDPFRGAGMSSMHLFKAAKNIEQSQGGGFRNHDVGVFMWEEIYKEIDAIGKRDYSSFGPGAQKKILKDSLCQLLAAILELHSSRKDVLKALGDPSSAIGSKLLEWGVNITELSKHIGYEELEHAHPDGKAKELIDGYIETILNTDPSNEGQKNSLPEIKLEDYEVIDTTKNQTSHVMQNDAEGLMNNLGYPVRNDAQRVLNDMGIDNKGQRQQSKDNNDDLELV